MTKKNYSWILGLLWGCFIIYFIVVFQQSNFWGNLLSPIAALGAYMILQYVYKKVKDFRTSWLMAALACLSWALVDLLWGIYNLGFGINPEDLTLFMYLYLLPNLFIALAFGIFLIKQQKKWNLYQLILDVIATASASASVIWILFFRDQFQLLVALDLETIATFLYILTDFFAISAIFLVYISKRTNNLSSTLRLTILGTLVYTGADLHYIYQSFNDLYIPNSIIDAIYMAGLFILASGGLLEIYKPTVASSMIKSSLPENAGSAKKVRLLLFVPLFLAYMKGFNAAEMLFLIGIVIVHQALSGYVQGAIQKEYMLKQEKEMNSLLEQGIKERTQELLKANQDLDILAKQDYLTGLFNRRYFLKKLDAMIVERSSPETVALFFMDLDRFKIVNDSYGHDVGDKTLIEIANRLKGWKSPAMLLARLGGDEFVITMKGEYDKQDIEEIAEEIIKLCHIPMTIDTYQLQVTISIGISLYPIDASDRNTLMKYADIAMYHAKGQDHQQYAFFNTYLSNKVQRKHELELLLKKADYHQEFELYYQPQFSIPQGELIGIEALLRWKSKEKGMISPGEFIPIAEEIGSIVKIGEWVMEKAIAQIAEWNKQYDLNLKMGINISPRQLNSLNFMHMFDSFIQAYDIKPEWLDIEITENSAMNNESTMEEMFTALANRGASISIDDFGTGYSSLSYIKRFDVNRLKIAKPLIDNISSNHSDRQIVKAIVMLAKAMAIKTIAEGVEYQDQLDQLINLGCDEVQGFFYSRPLPAKELEKIYLSVNEANKIVQVNS
ncbi:diguanylate cyclase (GGDEF) domain-containing protein [Natronincola peptidivorans]|uniref:Diguanylate cyclase (GGDEF) domain-containing protein n=1 Tax=Natronincola peptidivorans TaxID=426128 RepID=A0A1I0CDA5_9FIRM|nr:EAL domain-containing protein [Natronincola peptidivorans]SET17075.1 diguanylate cyclase (GGDEF) domain-containing protein [Natronincola peptidivorans]